MARRVQRSAGVCHEPKPQVGALSNDQVMSSKALVSGYVTMLAAVQRPLAGHAAGIHDWRGGGGGGVREGQEQCEYCATSMYPAKVSVFEGSGMSAAEELTKSKSSNMSSSVVLGGECGDSARTARTAGAVDLGGGGGT
eukprot:scaffold308401_cov21-Tisochrysis_lutea.AAC.1